MPNRVQLKRIKGYRKPPGCVSVVRPGPFGNPWTVEEAVASGLIDPEHAAEVCVKEFRSWLTRDAADPLLASSPLYVALAPRRAELLRHLPGLRGKDLACWCAIDAKWCHADVLLELANRVEASECASS